MHIPKEVLQVADVLKKHSYAAYLVGGCVRDLLMGKEPFDWDITTDAKPEEIQALFPDSVYENQFGTVGIKTETENPRLKIIEVTTFRTEGKYTDKRHPDEVTFAKTIEEDLARRDFTVNAIALDLQSKAGMTAGGKHSYHIVDIFSGQQDIKKKMIRAVGNPDDRFNEDALRMLRAVRFFAQLGFEIQPATEEAMKKHAGLLEFISKERIRDEFIKMMVTARAYEGVVKLQQLGLLRYIIPELEEGVLMEQNEHHIYSVFEHNVRSLQYSVSQNHSLLVRLAALLHDVGKPRTRRWKSKANGKKVRAGKRGDWTFYSHQVVGAKITIAILERLKFNKDIIEQAGLLVYEHMFVYDPDVVSLAGVRRLLSRVGAEHIDDLIKVREADRIGSGVPKAQPYRLRYLLAMIEKVKTDPISAKMLAIKGEEVIEATKLPPSKVIGNIIAILLEEVLADPKKNKKELLLIRAKELAKLEVGALDRLANISKNRAQEAQDKIDGEIKKKYFVK